MPTATQKLGDEHDTSTRTSLLYGLTGLAIGIDDQLEPFHASEVVAPIAIQNVVDVHDTALVLLSELAVGTTDQVEPFHASSSVGLAALGPSWLPTAMQNVVDVHDTSLSASSDE